MLYFYLKKATQILLPLSVFSFFFSHESSLSPLLLTSYDYLASNCSVKLFTYTTERNYVFLLCNGILVLIIQLSGLVSMIAPVRFTTHNNMKGVGSAIGGTHDHDVDGHESMIDGASVVVGSREVELSFEEKEVASDVVEVKDGIDMDNPSQEFDEGDEEGLSADELNKKCEDFIKKMKRELHGLVYN